MKRAIMITIALSLCIVKATGSSIPKNYVKTKTFIDESELRAITTYQFFDGLGRECGTASNGMGSNSLYVYTASYYDGNGRKNMQTMPVVGLGFPRSYSKTEMLSMLQSCYSDSHAYSKTSFDGLGRVLQTGGIGMLWHNDDKYIKKRYGCNASGSVKKYEAGEQLHENGYWQPSSLAMEETEDEDGNVVQVFKDFSGKTILERRDGDNDTYFVYDAKGLLRFVLTPMYQEDDDLDSFAYQYSYNDKGLCVTKKMPGCEYVQYWYDNYDRICYVQDGNLRNEGKYRYFLYDTFGRVVMQGLCTQICQSCGSFTTTTYTTSAATICGTGYALPSGNTMSGVQLESVSYFDDYNFLSGEGDGPQYNIVSQLTRQTEISPKGLQTGKAVMTTRGELLFEATYYDVKGNVVEHRRMMPGGHLLKTCTNYTFTNKPYQVVQQYLRDTITQTLAFNYEYYPTNDQVKRISLAYNGNAPVEIAYYTYNDIGQVDMLRQGNSASVTTYGYNVRGYINSIMGSKYTEQLEYAEADCYNGNIGRSVWRFLGDSDNISTFSYDGLNRLTDMCTESRLGNTIIKVFEDYNMQYDFNGNILNMDRSNYTVPNTPHPLPSLFTYSYNGNQLVKFDISRVGPPLAGQSISDIDKADENVEYTYDANGNMTQDMNRGIMCITYNDKNLPDSVIYSIDRYIKYEYTAEGEKLTALYVTPYDPGNPYHPHDSIPDFPQIPDSLILNSRPPGLYNMPQNTPLYLNTICTIDSIAYCGNFIYHNNQLEMMLFDGGYISLDSLGAPHYHFYQRDHLGSVRAVVDETGSTESTNRYTAFGHVANINDNYGLNRYKYNGKELDHTHGLDLLDYGARWYEPVIGRFTTMDPLCEKYCHISPYAYCGNNPVNFIDVDGREKIRAINPNPKDKVYEIEQQKKIDNTNIIAVADNFKDKKDIINIWAHGSETGMIMYYSNIDQEREITDSKSFEAFLNTNSNVWKNRKNGETVTIVLHSCETGKEGGFAEKISKDIPNVKVIAPNAPLYTDDISEWGVYRIRKTSISKGDLRPSLEGKWYQYENGRITDVFRGSYIPGQQYHFFSLW